MHEVEALIAQADRLTRSVRQIETALLCPLVQDFALLPITEALVTEVVASPPQENATQIRPLENISEAVLLLAVQISRRCRLAYIKTYYVGGHGGQDALVWDKGNVRFSR